MEYQSSTHPELTIPLILQTIINMIITSGGLTTTGIFRVAAKMSDVSSLRLRLETGHGSYVGNGIETIDPHIPACLLKLWLTELIEPLIPSEYYIALTQHSQDWGVIEKILAEFPPMNRKCLYYIINFLQLVMKEEDNKMNAHNIAIVMSPTICRAPIVKLEDVIHQTSTEAELCGTLLNHMPCLIPIFSFK